jgi:hypothetical protein
MTLNIRYISVFFSGNYSTDKLLDCVKLTVQFVGDISAYCANYRWKAMPNHIFEENNYTSVCAANDKSIYEPLYTDNKYAHIDTCWNDHGCLKK